MADKKNRNKRTIIGAVAGVALIAGGIIAAIIIINANKALKLSVVKSSWSGWSEDYEPQEETVEYDVQLDKKYIIKTDKVSDVDGNEWEEEVFSFEIKKIEGDSITIHANQKFSANKNGSVVTNNDQEYTFKIGEELELTTVSYDYGDIFKLSLNRK